MDSLKINFKNETLNFLKDINKDNFSKSYGALIEIIIKYKEKGISKNDVIQAIIEIMDMDINIYQDEILVEVSNRLEGFCTPGKEIDW